MTKLTKKLSYINDVLGNKYIGFEISKQEIKKYLLDFKQIIFSGKIDDRNVNNVSFEKKQEYLKVLIEKQQTRDHGNYHITFMSVMEYGNVISTNQNIPNDLFDINFDIELSGIGKLSYSTNNTYFIVANCEKGNKIRRDCGLNDKDFHITIGFKDKDLFNGRKNSCITDDYKEPIVSILLKKLKESLFPDEKPYFLEHIKGYPSDITETVPLSKIEIINNTHCVVDTTDFKIGITVIEDSQKNESIIDYDDLYLCVTNIVKK